MAMAESGEGMALTRGGHLEGHDDIGLVKPLPVTGLTVTTALFFIIGQVAGGGTVAIADGFANVGWLGVAFALLSAGCNTFVSIILTKCYVILEEREGSSLKHVRDPYTDLIGKALGKRARILGSVLFHIYVISVTTVFLLVSAEMISGFLHFFLSYQRLTNEFRIWVAVFAVVITPLTYFGTPKEFWGVALVAFMATALAVVFIIIRLALQHSLQPIILADVPTRVVTWRSLFSGLGTILFAMAGVPLFPALIADMKVKKDFYKAVIWSYLVLCMIYLPLALYAFLVVGDKLEANILASLMKFSEPCHGCQSLVPITQAFLGIHFVFGYLLVLNPLCQEVEEAIGIPKHLCWQRCLIRTLLVLGTLLLAESIPSFGTFLSLVGGTIVTVITYVLPCLAYLKLQDQISLHSRVLIYELLGVGTVICLGSLWSSVLDVIDLYK